ncbi:carboxypeptidase-like regulatory domain-containing protein [Chitinophaga horti]|uniref:Carboxypeptidase-like regulatory domain-containing protein n=1 Tax=Chitinophaga horti TaxID=2920382 RepID=A0ABY6J057_9BACT|nr:carboxypeptidase-like regulatory domain-containing protein [Chitinophaga horti]UYQ93005.1 carboxypeptidase-like regulatory domain-containing protein [Chitinophaga horti]
MTERGKHITPTAELIRQYLEGTLDDRTMHALEKQALDDPFLADALDGFATEPAALAPGHVEDLHARLEHRVIRPAAAKVRRINYYWAAAAVFLVLFSGGLYWMMQPTQKAALVATQRHVQDSVNPVSNTVAPPAAESEALPPVAATQDKVKVEEWAAYDKSSPGNEDQVVAKSEAGTPSSNAAPAPVTPPAKLENIEEPKAASARKKEAAAEIVLAQRNALASMQAKQEVDSLRIASAALSARQLRDSQATVAVMLEGKMAGVTLSETAVNKNKRVIKGRVSDLGDNPLPGVTIFQKDTRNAVSTDNKGQFEIELDSTHAADLAFNYIGYEQRGLRLRPNENEVSVTMFENKAALNDVVIVGYGTQKKKASVPINPPRPKDGYMQYDDYLSSNTKYTQHMSLAGVNDSVEVSFDVFRDGSLGNFKIEKGLDLAREVDKAAREEAIRVIKEGPKWAPASNNKKTRVKVFVKFKPGSKGRK